MLINSDVFVFIMAMSSPSSSVIWSDHWAFVAHGLSKLFEEGKQSDLTIKCHEREFAVHKLILNLFTDHFSEVDGLWIRINVNPSHMEKMLLFMYKGQVCTL